MIFIHNNTFSFSENSMATFVGNRAVDTGGAIYIVTSTLEVISRFSLSEYIVCTNCFLSLDDYMVATSFKSHEICRISTFLCLTSYCLHIVIVNTLYLV